MTADAIIQAGAYFAVLVLLAYPLGLYMGAVYEGQRVFLTPVVGPLERLVYRVMRVDPASEMSWKGYSLGVLWFSLFGLALLFAIQLLQGGGFLNPEHLPGVDPFLAFNTAASFVANTNWQAYGGENTMSYLTQMSGLAVQNFLSAAAGMAVCLVLIRGFTRRQSETVGNFWVDMTRGVLYILLPLSLILSVALVSQGVVQNFHTYQRATLTAPYTGADGKEVTTQLLPQGPAASQIAIKQLGTNGGGFFNANSAHPYENPNPLSNFLEMLSLMLIPAGFVFMFGRMARDMRQGWALFVAMSVIFVVAVVLAITFEQKGTPQLAAAGVELKATALQSGGNMEGKEVRFGVVDSAIWAVATTSTSNGSVNSMHDSYTPLGGMIPMVEMQLGEVIFGGVGSGLYGMLLLAIVTVFLGGLMVGRTPEYLGKKIGSYEMKMTVVGVLIVPVFLLIGTAVAVMVPGVSKLLNNPGPHGFSELLYAYTEALNNNGSAFAGLDANTPFMNLSIGIAILIGRYGVIFPAIAIGGSLARKKAMAASAGTLPTHGPLFIVLLIFVILIVAGLNHFPALSLGPIAEQLQMLAR